ncbi:MAG: hypothetical protein K0R09_3441 [Clostridiales bacterium]|jgi:hypothetical protein|nr:hypothetical protein [Clostridiales bacterium]
MKKIFKHKNGGTMIITDPNLESIMKREGFEFVKDLEPKKEDKKTEE